MRGTKVARAAIGHASFARNFHVGIGYDASVYPERGGRVYVRAPSEPARVGVLTDFFTFTGDNKSKYRSSNGLLVPSVTNTPRVLCKLDGTPDGLLIEQTKANLILQSEDFTTTWALSNGSLTANATTGPDGSATADKLTEAAAGAGSVRHFFGQAITKAASALQYAASVWVKNGGQNFAAIRITDGPQASDVRCSVNLTTGVMSATVTNGAGFSIQNSYAEQWTNGWYRLVFVFTSSTDTTLRFEIGTDNNNDATALAYVGDGASAIYMFGSQLELGAYASSYIPTTTVAVTRATELLSRQLGAEFDTTKGTFIVDARLAQATVGGVNQFILDANTNGASSNQSTFFAAIGGTIRQSINSAGGFAGLATTNVAITDDVQFKGAGAWQLNDVQVARDNVLGNIDTSAPLPAATLTQLNVGNSADGSQVCGRLILRRFDYHARRYQDGQLTAVAA